MICDFYGGPNDGWSTVITDDLCDIYTLHEVGPPPADPTPSPMHEYFEDPTVVAVRTITAIYQLNGIVRKLGIEIAHLDFVGYHNGHK